jgi:nucleoside-diphosphate-sugar epimerase
MRVLVTGGTGLIGRHVVGELLAAGHRDVAVTTRDLQGRDRWQGRVRLEQAFAGDALSLAKAMTGVDVVVHAIQFPNHPVEDPGKGRTYMEVDGQGTEVAAQVARSLGVRRFVYLSGAGAGEGRPQSWMQAKDRAEKAIRESGMEYAILRPSWVYGPGDRSMSKFVAFTRYLPFFTQIGDGQAPVYPVYVKDLAQAVAQCALREDATDKVLNVGSPRRMTMDEVVRTLQKVLGKRRPIVHHPKAFMKLAAWPMRVLPTPPLSPAAVDFVTQVVEMDPKPAMEYLGFELRGLEAGLRDYLL